MAFLDRLDASIRGYGLYCESVLNSGVTFAGPQIEFVPEAFSFLKLHASVGTRTIGFTPIRHINSEAGSRAGQPQLARRRRTAH